MWEKHNRKKREDVESRKKRSISRERYVEVMVVVDKEMMDFYKHEDVQTYVLTIMNMVNTFLLSFFFSLFYGSNGSLYVTVLN